MGARRSYTYTQYSTTAVLYNTAFFGRQGSTGWLMQAFGRPYAPVAPGLLPGKVPGILPGRFPGAGKSSRQSSRRSAKRLIGSVPSAGQSWPEYGALGQVLRTCSLEEGSCRNKCRDRFSPVRNCLCTCLCGSVTGSQALGTGSEAIRRTGSWCQCARLRTPPLGIPAGPGERPRTASARPTEGCTHP